MNVVIYARYSSNKQDENTIDAQLRYCHEYCERNNHTVVGEYIDRATSASKEIEKRTSFLRMIQDSEKHTFDAVLVFKLDRFARNRYDSATYKNKLKRNGVSVLSCTENISEDKESIILESVLEGMAEYFSKDLAEKVTSGMREAAMKCQYNGGVIPIGYKIENKKYVLDPNKSHIVLEAFQRYANGETMSKIADDFNHRLIKTSRGGAWNKNSFHAMFSNVRYKGTYVFQDIVIENGIPRIVTDELWDIVNRKQNANKLGSKNIEMNVNYLLSGKLICGCCGAKMYGEYGTGRGGVLHYYYKCSAKKKYNSCNSDPLRKDAVESLVMQHIINALTPETVECIADIVMKQVEYYNNEHDVTLPIKNELAEIDTKIKQISIALESYFSETLIENLKAHEKRKKVLTKELANTKKKQINIDKDMIRYYFSKLMSSDINDITVQQQIVSILVDKIVVKDKNHLDIQFNLESLGLPVNQGGSSDSSMVHLSKHSSNQSVSLYFDTTTNIIHLFTFSVKDSNSFLDLIS